MRSGWMSNSLGSCDATMGSRLLRLGADAEDDCADVLVMLAATTGTSVE
jgi:hypothetical protein